MPPDWVKDAVFYQIFPDRFANGDPTNDPVNVQPWGSTPTIRGFQGGDLKGIVNRFDYLLELGINAIYLNPIFLSSSNHRYNATDYYQIDTKLGSLGDFKHFLDHAHANDVRVILDGVFNHCGRGFFAFQDLLENENQSPYVDWFHVKRFPLDAFGKGKAENYKAWWGFRSLPEFNTSNPRVRQFIFDVAKYWIDEGIDGWRLDVPNEIDDDEFWFEFREITKGANPEAYLVGEIWEANPRWVNDTHFDGLMNYPLRDLLIDLVVKENTKASEFASRLNDLLNTYQGGYFFSQLLTLGSHDTIRLMTICQGNVDAVQLINLVQFCLPGAPHIYYGDEIGLEGGKDPACRGAFPWDPGAWDRTHLDYIRKLITIRKQFDQLRNGDFNRLAEVDEDGVIAFSREVNDQAAVVVINAGRSDTRFSMGADHLPFQNTLKLYDVLNDREISWRDQQIELKLQSLKGAIIVTRE